MLSKTALRFDGTHNMYIVKMFCVKIKTQQISPRLSIAKKPVNKVSLLVQKDLPFSACWIIWGEVGKRFAKSPDP